MSRSRRRYDERGIALPTLAALGSAAAVLVAGGAFVATAGGAPPAARPEAAPASTPTRHATVSPPPAPATVAPKPVLKKKHRTPDVRRGHTYVEVYNNSGITGLAGSTAKKIADAGWQVVGSDNWYGTIPASTIYYPSRLHAEAKLLAKDLGIHRLHPAISPMKFDRLTVILTSDYS